MSARARPLSRLWLAAGFLCLARPACAVSPAAQPVLQDAVALVFALRFEEARRRIRGLIEVEPGEPAGYLMEAAAIWWEASTEPVLGKVEGELERRFAEDLKTALKLAKKRSKTKDPRARAEAEFLWGMGHGLEGLWAQHKGEARKALALGRKAERRFRRCLDFDPDFTDAYFGLGVYDDLRGRADAVYELRSAYKGGKWTSPAAGYFLLRRHLLKEGDYTRGLQILVQLRERFPESPAFALIEVVTLSRLEKWSESRKAAEALFDSLATRPELLGRRHPRLLCGFYAELCLERATMLAVAEWISRAVESRAARGALKSLYHLYRGIAHDLTGNRDLAEADYERVGGYKETARLLAARDVCRSAPCDRRKVVELLEELSGFPADAKR